MRQSPNFQNPAAGGAGTTQSPVLTVYLKEIEEVRKPMESSRTALFTVFGVVFPAFVAVFALAAKDFSKDMSIPATLFVVLASLGTMWAQNLWMEMLRYVRFYYVELMPRVYALIGQSERRNFLEWSGGRSAQQWLPIGLFQLGYTTLMIAAYWGFVRGTSFWLEVACVAFMMGAVVSVIVVLRELRSIEADIARLRCPSRP